MEYDKLSKRLFAAFYDMLNMGVESRVVPYRRLTAGVSLGRVLEIGGGTGANLPFYPENVGLHTVEPNPHMVRRFRATAADCRRNVTIVGAIGERLPFADCAFDTVVTTLTLCMVKDLAAVIGEIRRVLKPGGRFLFYEHVVSSEPWIGSLQAFANPVWRFATTGCNLDRDIGGAIAGAFSEVDYRSFSIGVAPGVKIPNIVGSARA